MKPSDIKAAIEKKGYTIGLIAEALGVRASSVSVVINGHSSSRRTANFIAKVIGQDVTHVFPRQGTYSRQPPRGAVREVKREELKQLLAS